jgi:seryl-tRNA synthetase
LVDLAVSTDDQRKKIQFELDSQLSEMNKISKEIGALMKEGKKEEAEAAKQKTTDIKERSKELQHELNEVEKSLLQILYQIPNIPNELVKAGVSETDNKLYSKL